MPILRHWELLSVNVRNNGEVLEVLGRVKIQYLFMLGDGDGDLVQLQDQTVIAACAILALQASHQPTQTCLRKVLVQFELQVHARALELY